MKPQALSSFADTIRGVTFAKNDSSPQEAPNTLPVLRAGNIQSELHLDSNILFVESSKITDKQRLRKNDIVMCTSSGSIGVLGKTGIMPYDWPGSFGAFCVAIRVDESKCHASYLHHYLRSPLFLRWVRKSDGVNIKNIRKSSLEELTFPLPPLSEQKRIAAILDKADAIRRKRKAALAMADEFLRATFLDMFGDPVTNPKGWKDVSLSTLADITSGVTKGKKLARKETKILPYMRVANVQDGRIDLDVIKTIEVSTQDAKKYTLKPGDLLLTEGGDPDKLGRGAVWHGEIAPCIHQNHIFRVRFDSNEVVPEFASVQIGSARGKRYFLKAGKQTTGIASINKTQLSGFPFLMPPYALQRKFLTICEALKAKAARLVELQFESESLFASLSQRAFRGEL